MHNMSGHTKASADSQRLKVRMDEDARFSPEKPGLFGIFRRNIPDLFLILYVSYLIIS